MRVLCVCVVVCFVCMVCVVWGGCGCGVYILCVCVWCLVFVWACSGGLATVLLNASALSQSVSYQQCVCHACLCGNKFRICLILQRGPLHLLMDTGYNTEEGPGRAHMPPLLLTVYARTQVIQVITWAPASSEAEHCGLWPPATAS